MDFDNLNQAIGFIQRFQRFYQTVRIMDVKTGALLYEGRSLLCTGTTSPPEVLKLREVTLFFHPDTDTFGIKLPAVIDRQACSMELAWNSQDKKELNPAIQELIMTDALTGLYNRRFIDEQLPRDLEQLSVSEGPLSIIYADIDFFKKINDSYGHVMGDCVIRETADIFRQLVQRKDGWVARYGGDEFLICLPGMNQPAAVKMANRMRTTIEKRECCVGTHSVKISCSFGVQTLYQKDQVKTLAQVVERSDKKLYKAKANGRNRVVV